MIHAQVVRTVIGYAVTYGPRAYRAYKTTNFVRTMKSEHKNNWTQFGRVESGTVPTTREWWL